jgi:hypothetical protein
VPTNLPEWKVDLPEDQRTGSLREDIDRWIRSPELAALAEVFGAPSPSLDTGPLLAWYDDLSSDHWDFRGGKERNLAERPTLTPEQTDAAMEAAAALGLSAPSPPSRDTYDYCLILGGLVRACVTRPRFAAELASQGTAFEQVVALGGFRPLDGDEFALAELMGIRASNEFQAMDAGIRQAFKIDYPATQKFGEGSEGNSDWRIHDYAEARCSVVAAPSSDPAIRRANSADTFVWWAEREPEIYGAHVLLVTNAIYVPYQGSAATQVLGMRFGLQVETIGVSASAADLGEHTQSFTASNYLQEIRSGIRGMRSLYTDTY